MNGLWKRARQYALMVDPDDNQLADYLDCYSAGYGRGFKDYAAPLPEPEQAVRITMVGKRLAQERTALEAGCWLAGYHSGHQDSANGEWLDSALIAKRFCQSWEAADVATRALECEPHAVSTLQLLTTLCQLRKIPSIYKRLTNMMVARRQFDYL